jgi:uncharacterized protein
LTDPAVQLVLLAVAGVAAGYINSVAGAGSLLTLPALIFTGLDAVSANATNRVAVVFQNMAAVVTYHRAGRGSIRQGLALSIPGAVGAVGGAVLASHMTDAQLRLAIAIAMVVFLVLSLLPRPAAASAGASPTGIRTNAKAFAGFVAIGFYAGFLQAGVGILILLYLAFAHGVDFVTGNAIKVVLVLLLAVASLAVFVAGDVPIDPLRGLVLAASTTLGGYLGASAAIRRGEAFVRTLLVLAVLGSVAKLAWDAL